MVLHIGHRGTAGTAPENTLVSFKRALAIGADGVEFDIHRTRDGEFVVMHDFSIERCTNGTGVIADMTASEIRQYDAGSWKGPEFAGERVPTLTELVEALPAPFKLFLELKAGSYRYPGIEADLARFILERGLEDRLQVSSFDHEALLRLRQLAPSIQTGMLYQLRPVDPIGMARACGATALHPNWACISAAQVAAAHAAGLQVNVWTVNTPEAVATCKALGVDGMMSDFPERL
ncbi:MAG: glycerophosphodiester phosphodiesterase [Mycobacterium leprae]